jgi:hypothetical protein
MSFEELKREYTISTDRSKLNISIIHNYISNESYWGKGRSLEVVKKSIENSLPFGVYYKKEMIGFARVLTDYATFAWVADVFILTKHRSKGLSKWVNGNYTFASGTTRFQEMGACYKRCPRTLQEVWVP